MEVKLIFMMNLEDTETSGCNLSKFMYTRNVFKVYLRIFIDELISENLIILNWILRQLRKFFPQRVFRSFDLRIGRKLHNEIT